VRKFTVEFDPEVESLLDSIAQARKCSKVDVVRHALNVYAFLEEKVRHGGDIFFTEKPDGEKGRFVLGD